MVHINSVTRGLSKYVDNDLVPKLDGWQRWVLGAGAALLLSNVPAKFGEIRKLPIIAFMDVIDDNGMIDVDRVFQEVSKQARLAPITLDLSKMLLPPLTIDHTDVEKIYRYIQEG